MTKLMVTFCNFAKAYRNTEEFFKQRIWEIFAINTFEPYFKLSLAEGM
jgi:hypothetical protein